MPIGFVCVRAVAAGTLERANPRACRTPSPSRCPTVFPTGPTLGATFDKALWREVGLAIGMEARALSNQQVARGKLLFYDPNINLMRDPRWATGQRCPTLANMLMTGC